MRPVDPHAPAAPMLSVVVVALHPSGFEVRMTVADLAALDQVIAQLQAAGYRATTRAGGGDGWQRTPEGLPICPFHNVAMRERSKQKDTWFSHRLETADPQTGEIREVFCRGYGNVSNLP